MPDPERSAGSASDRGRKNASASQTFATALALLRRRERPRATQLFRDVLRTDPRHFGALCHLAMLCLEAGEPAEGLALIRQALRQQPDSADGVHAEACLLRALGRVPEAIASFRRAIAIKPDFTEAYSNLGGLYCEQRQYQAALPLYQKALQIRPDFPELQNNMGVALLGLGRAQPALEHFAMALVQKPDFAEALGNQGSALVSLGRLAEACKAFEGAIRLAPDSGKFYLDLARCRRFEVGHPGIAAMQARAREPAGMSPESRVELQFALAKAFADCGQTEQSFGHLRQGNALKRVNIVYHEAETLAMLRHIPAAFAAELFGRRPGTGNNSSTPVFVVGMPRSGTTLVEQILASHPKVFGAGERPELHQAVARFAGGEAETGALFDRLAGLPDEGLQQLGRQYVEDLAPLAPDAERIVDKMPGNFLFVGLIALALPNARVIHVRRDPVDTCLSCFSTLFSGHQPYAYNLAELGRYYRAYAALMQHWRQVVPSTLLLEVAYEDLVRDLEAQARRMVAHCGLEWDARCLEFHRTQRIVQTASKVQVRQPLYNTSVGRSQGYRELLGPLLRALDASRNAESSGRSGR